jgi:dihydrodipicolinate synthase/N-acetylneuraminate lyase
MSAPRFDHLQGVFGLLPTPYRDDYEILTPDLLAAAEFCIRTGQHGIVWPVMVGEFYFLGEEERIRNLDAVLEEVNGRLPVVFGSSGVSLPQVLLFARAAQQAGADAVIAMAPAQTNAAIAMDMFRRLADVYDGPIILQNAAAYAPLTGEQIARLIEDVPQIEYVKEERSPGPRHIAEIGDRVGVAAGKRQTICNGRQTAVICNPVSAQNGHIGHALRNVYPSGREVEKTGSIFSRSNSRYHRALPEQCGRLGAIPRVHCPI